MPLFGGALCIGSNNLLLNGSKCASLRNKHTREALAYLKCRRWEITETLAFDWDTVHRPNISFGYILGILSIGQIRVGNSWRYT